MNKFFKELILWLFIALPYVYLAQIWNQLPDQVPTHFNIHGEADDWSSKTALLWLPGAMCIGMYLLLLWIPSLDPKGKIQQMGDKYYTLRFILTVFFSVFAMYLIYLSSAGNLSNPNILLGLIGLLFAMLGNYFQTIRPNYFIGIRTPWTLESEHVWKKTHQLGGKLWMVGGLLIILLAILINNNQLFMILFIGLVSIMTLIPIVYSYTEFKREKVPSRD